MVSGHHYERIFILGPSHHCYLSNQIAISQFDEVQTPFGGLKCDTELATTLSRYPGFISLQTEFDVKEHSLEMQFPFVHYLFQDGVPVVPMLVGPFTNSSLLESVTQQLQSFVDDETLFIISSDFCHWGSRFDYFYRFDTCVSISKSIELMDKHAIDILTRIAPSEFDQFLVETEATICGRNPLTLFLRLLQRRKGTISGQLLHYAQSNGISSKNDSSVSYASIAYTWNSGNE